MHLQEQNVHRNIYIICNFTYIMIKLQKLVTMGVIIEYKRNLSYFQ